ncbi:MAG: hypothetical protein N2692_01085 [Patescibacteria group bacterium]|nr:hypothetical protein [Patescibacteria group bacterium]
MERIMSVLSFFILPIIVFYGFALILGKTKEANRAVKKMFQAVFQFVIDVISSIVVFIFQKLTQLHKYFYKKNSWLTVIVEAGLLIVAAILIL